jgi:hypothetical protein
MNNQQNRVGRMFTATIWNNRDDWTVCEYLGNGIYLLSGRWNGLRTCRWSEISK